MKTPNKRKYVGAKNLHEAFKLNGFSINKNNDLNAKTIYFENDTPINEIVGFEFENKGGIITFSVNVNAVNISANKIYNFVKKKIEILKNILFKNKKINNVISKHEEVYGVTIGNFVKGRYKAENGSLYDETSMSVEIIGITSDVLDSVAESLAKEFKQETVLVKNYETNKIYLVS